MEEASDDGHDVILLQDTLAHDPHEVINIDLEDEESTFRTKHEKAVTCNKENESSLTECPICLEAFQKGGDRRVVVTKCGHCFCFRCIAIVVNSRGPCPKCRSKLGKISNLVNLYDTNVAVVDNFIVEGLQEQLNHEKSKRVKLDEELIVLRRKHQELKSILSSKEKQQLIINTVRCDNVIPFRATPTSCSHSSSSSSSGRAGLSTVAEFSIHGTRCVRFVPDVSSPLTAIPIMLVGCDNKILKITVGGEIVGSTTHPFGAFNSPVVDLVLSNIEHALLVCIICSREANLCDISTGQVLCSYDINYPAPAPTTAQYYTATCGTFGPLATLWIGGSHGRVMLFSVPNAQGATAPTVMLPLRVVHVSITDVDGTQRRSLAPLQSILSFSGGILFTQANALWILETGQESPRRLQAAPVLNIYDIKSVFMMVGPHIALTATYFVDAVQSILPQATPPSRLVRECRLSLKKNDVEWIAEMLPGSDRAVAMLTAPASLPRPTSVSECVSGSSGVGNTKESGVYAIPRDKSALCILWEKNDEGLFQHKQVCASTKNHGLEETVQAVACYPRRDGYGRHSGAVLASATSSKVVVYEYNLIRNDIGNFSSNPSR